ncbi:hypothetical protein C8R43DRAFT_1193390 [Mycena crocata]|nr:hypothetical protein C8R43DRAFT_1193390 [Mycena crocata]
MPPSPFASASQSNNSPTGAQRVDEAPVVQTKAKMNHASPGVPQDTRQRQTLADEDAPPMNSVNDIPTEMCADSSFQPRNSALNSALNSSFARKRPPPTTPASFSTTPMLYITVFGYPPDKYSLTVVYFASLGATSPPEPHLEISNCFKIGYRDPADAMHAVRKSGEVLGGNWMVGAKWADAAQAEALLSQPVARHASPEAGGAMAVDGPGYGAAAAAAAGPGYGGMSTPTLGTPIKLAPSASAFRRGATSTPNPKPTPPAAPQAGWGGGAAPAAPAPSTPNKGVLGQVGDMIFGW